MPDPAPLFGVLCPSDARRAAWIEDLGTDAVPITDDPPRLAAGPDGDPEMFLLVDVARLDAAQLGRVVARMADRFGVPAAEIHASLAAGEPLSVRAEGLAICSDPELGRRAWAEFEAASTAHTRN